MIFVASRGRPMQLERFMKACQAMHTVNKIVIRLDIDDPCGMDYIDALKDFECVVITNKRIGFAASMNELFGIYHDAHVYFMMADDVVPETDEWDTKMARVAMARDVVFSNDQFHKARQPTHMAIGGDLARACGWLVPNGFVHLYNDQIWEYIGRALDRYHYLEDVSVPHMHFSNLKAPMDRTYEDHFEHSKNDKVAWDLWREKLAPRLIERLKANGF